MPETEWDNKAEYLRSSRISWFNLDYIEFLVKCVWRIEKPVKIADFGCGNGYLGSVLLPLLPEGSTYTGYDKSQKLIENAEEFFSIAPYKTEFRCCDMLETYITEQYDFVICQTLLMHIPLPERMLQRMIKAAVPGGFIVCVETNWNVGNAAMYIDGLDVDGYCNLGLLAKLWKKEREAHKTDKCIGMKIPPMMQKFGLKNIGIRMNDCVRFANPCADKAEYQRQISTFLADGWGHLMGDEQEYIQQLQQRGVTLEEAKLQYQCEKEINEFVIENKDNLTVLTIPPMFISYGTK